MSFSVKTAPKNILREKTEALLKAMEEATKDFVETVQTATPIKLLFNPLRLSDNAKNKADELKVGVQILKDELSKARNDNEVQEVRIKAFFLIGSITPYYGLKKEIQRCIVGASGKGKLEDEGYIDRLINEGKTDKVFAKGQFSAVWKEKLKEIDLGGRVGLTLGDVMRKEVDAYLSKFNSADQKEQIEKFASFIDNVFPKYKSQRSIQ